PLGKVHDALVEQGLEKVGQGVHGVSLLIFSVAPRWAWRSCCASACSCRSSRPAHRRTSAATRRTHTHRIPERTAARKAASLLASSGTIGDWTPAGLITRPDG